MGVPSSQESTLIPALLSLSLSPVKRPTKRFDQLPIGLNQRSPTYSVQFRGRDDEPGVPLYKFLELGDCKRDAGGVKNESEDARYCVDLNEPLGDAFDKNTKYFNILAKLEVRLARRRRTNSTSVPAGRSPRILVAGLRIVGGLLVRLREYHHSVRHWEGVRARLAGLHERMSLLPWAKATLY